MPIIFRPTATGDAPCIGLNWGTMVYKIQTNIFKNADLIKCCV